MAGEFNLVSVQAAIFLADSTGYSQSSFLGTVLSKYSDRYDGKVQTLPIPDDDPASNALPQIMLESKNNQWKLHSGKRRIDSFWLANPEDVAENEIDIISECVQVLTYYARTIGVLKIRRMGFLIAHLKVTDNATLDLVSRFVNPIYAKTIFSNSQDFEIHNHFTQRLDPLEHDINVWIRCKSALAQPDLKRVLVVEQDINTIDDENSEKRFSPDDVDAFFFHAFETSRDVFGQYFPEVQP